MGAIRVESEGQMEMSKRCYVPVVIKVKCAHCGEEISHDFSEDYLSYPLTNDPIKVGFYCEACDEESKVDVILRVAIEFDPDKVEKY